MNDYGRQNQTDIKQECSLPYTERVFFVPVGVHIVSVASRLPLLRFYYFVYLHACAPIGSDADRNKGRMGMTCNKGWNKAEKLQLRGICCNQSPTGTLLHCAILVCVCVCVFCDKCPLRVKSNPLMSIQLNF